MSEQRFTMNVVQRELEDILEEQGQVTPQAVVDRARDPRSPLHSRFEWNDTVAAEKYRQTQAQDLIRRVKLVYSEEEGEEPKSVRAWVSTHQTQDPARRGYVPTAEVVKDPIATKVLLSQLEREINSLKQRYGHLSEFADLMQRALV